MIKRIMMGMAVAAAGIAGSQESGACTRVVYSGTDSLYVVGRSLDWKTPIPTNLYVYPAGVHKVGHSLPGAVEWTSRYGAVYAVGYDGGVTEGMNEKGLVVNGLFCKGTVYENDDTRNRPPLSLALFPAWMLDQCATTQEAIDMLVKHEFNITGSTFDGGTVSALHWAITDKQGNTAVFEFDNGDINVYQGDDIPVLTNDPPFPQMNAINDYWKKVGGVNMLPGTVKSPDRFVRAYFFVHNVERVPDADLGFSICRSILVNASVPYTYTVQGEGNVSSTQWRSFANVRDLRYYFDIVTNMGAFYIDLNQCDLRPGAKIMKLDTSNSSDFLGNVTKKMQKHPGFTPMY